MAGSTPDDPTIRSDSGSAKGGEVRCPECGGTLPTSGPLAGVCPHCLLLGAMKAGAAHRVEVPVTPASGSRSVQEEAATGPYQPTVPTVKNPATTPAPPAAPPGRMPERIDRYRVLHEVGRGGMGIVYLAEDERLKRRVAIKVLHHGYSADKESVSRFLQEARSTAKAGADSAHIITLFGDGDLADGAPYFVMEWLKGTTLGALLAKEKRLSAERTFHIARQIADAIDAAHRNGIVHRDLKPENVFLIERGGDPDFVKVLDFGIAKVGEGSLGVKKTGTGVMIGTPQYMSPEQCQGVQIDHLTDVYALGIVVYELLTGSVPFDGAMYSVVHDHIYEPPPKPSLRAPELSPWIDDVLGRALAKERSQRPPSAARLVFELMNPPASPTWRGPAPPPDPPLPPDPIDVAPLPKPARSDQPTRITPRPPLRRRPWRIVAAAASGVATLLAIGWLAWPDPRPEPGPLPTDAGAPVADLQSNPPARPLDLSLVITQLSPDLGAAPPRAFDHTVSSNPAGATVHLNGKPQGKTPCRLHFAGDGPFVVELSGPDLKPKQLHFDSVAEVRSRRGRLVHVVLELD